MTSGERPRVLVVDDDALTRKLHARYVDGLGFEAVTAGNGVEAMAALDQRWPLTAAVIDWHMAPLNGYAFASAVRADPAYAGLRLVMVTSEDRTDYLERAYRVGVDAVLPKPLSQDALERALRQALVDPAEQLAPSPTVPAPEVPRSMGQIAQEVALELGCRLGLPLGRGGMAEVFRLERGHGEPLALKISTQCLEPEGVPARRFRREAEILQRLRHPNLLRVESHGAVDGFCYLVMEQLDGDLLDLMDQRGGRLSPDEARRLMAQCAAALALLHREGILHRDLKPANILMRAGDSAVLSDLGLAAFSGGLARMTTSGNVLGTPAYLAPEAVLGRIEDPISADLYGLGATWFHCLVGRPPFEAATVFATFQQIVREPLPDLGRLLPGLPAEDRSLLERCLAKDPAERPPDAEALVRALDSGAGIA